jgi:hypothetical protein
MGRRTRPGPWRSDRSQPPRRPQGWTLGPRVTDTLREGAASGGLTLPVGWRALLAVLDGLVVMVVLAVVVVHDPQDLDEAEGGPQPPQGRHLVGSTSAMNESATAVVAPRGAPPMAAADSVGATGDAHGTAPTALRGVRAPYRRTAHTAHTAIRGCVVGRHVGACGLRAERIPVRSRASALPPGVIDAYLG